MHLNKVSISENVIEECLEHAMSFEKEEIMGLLIGQIDNDSKESIIFYSKILPRSDKKADRVEISPEQLSEAAEYAEILSCKLDLQLTVLGWYHSHPHITVYPSIIDLGTQAQYQQLEKYFIGLIFSVYNTDKNSLCPKVDMICFQNTSSANNAMVTLEIPCEIIPTNQAIHVNEFKTPLFRELLKEQNEVYKQSLKNSRSDYLTQKYNEAVYEARKAYLLKKVSIAKFVGIEEENISRTLNYFKLIDLRNTLRDALEH